MSSIPRQHHWLAWGCVGIAVSIVLFRFWTSLCFFPLPEWNQLRLAPSFMLRLGQNPYPGTDGSALTTWIYGPVPFLLNLPLTWLSTLPSALLGAAVFTLLLALLPLTAIAFFHPGEFSRADRVVVLLLCLACWPNTSFHYIQADNAALAFGLISNLLLLRQRGGASRALLVIAAVCAALAVWSKQTTLALIPGQILWLLAIREFRTAAIYTAMCALAGVLLGGLFTSLFGFRHLWLNLVEIPGQHPFASSLVQRTIDFRWQLLGYLGLPVLGLVLGRRMVWRRESPWLLPALCWLCLLPGAVAGTYRIGGAPNSLNNALYLLPPAGFVLFAFLRRRWPHLGSTLGAGAAALLGTLVLLQAQLLPIRPLTQALQEAEILVRDHPGGVYFPWHPLVSYFGEHRFYHTEDGLQIRVLAHQPLGDVGRGFPPRWTMTAIPGWREPADENYTRFQPADRETVYFGHWTIYRWPAPVP